MDPKVWIGCLACYGGGDLVGEWFDAADCPTAMPEFDERVKKVGDYHAGEGHEELWVMDFEDFGGFITGECSPSDAKRVAEQIQAIEADHIDPRLVAYWAEGIAGLDLSELEWDAPTAAAFQDSYRGQWDSVMSYLDNYYTECYGEQLEALPDAVRYAIDWGQVADTHTELDEFRIDGEIHLFDTDV